MVHQSRRFGVSGLACGVLLLVGLAAAPARAADTRVWSFGRDLEGWAPQNWETTEVRGGALVGVTKFDAQVMSPVLDIQAEDYPEMLVRIRSDRSASGELFFSAPGAPMSGEREVHYSLVGGSEFGVCRVALGKHEKWKGAIDRVRFDPLNAAGARIEIDFIALMPEAGLLLINGGAEILTDGKPFEWTGGPDAQAALVTDETPFAGAHALRLTGTGWWEPVALDMSFLGRFLVSGQVRVGNGSAPRYTVQFCDVNGAAMPPVEGQLQAAVGGWAPFSFTFDPPRRAAAAKVRFSGTPDSVADLDNVQVRQQWRGAIVAGKANEPHWQAQWIWHPNALNKENIHAYFRGEFDVPDKPVRSAQLQVTVDDAYALWVNGKEVVKMTTDADGWKVPEVVDLKPFLHPGRNVLAVDAMNAASAAGVIAEGVVVFEDDTEQAIATGGAWKAALSVADGWQSLLETPADWKPAAVLGTPPCPPWGNLPCRFLAREPDIEFTLTPAATELIAPAPVRLSVTAKAVTRVAQPVYVAAAVVAGDKELAREWGPKVLFAPNAAAGSSERIDDWVLRVPYGTPPGPVTIRLSAYGARCVPAAPEARVTVSVPPSSSGYPTTRIEVRDGVARITVDGKVIDSTQALFNFPDDLHMANAKAAGVKLWSVALDGMGWTEKGFDYTAVDQALARYLEVDPEAWLLPTFDMGTHDHAWWIKAHPEARCRLEDGNDTVGDYAGGRRTLPSYGSEVWQQAYGEALRNLVRHLKESPFAPRIVGYQPCTGISWEWFHWGSQSGELVDYSEAGVNDFRRWLTAKYGTDAALQAAWHDPKATLAGAPVPSNARRRGPAQGVFFDPATQQDVLDYNRYQHEVVADSIMHFAKIIKDESGGRCIVGTYYGYVMHLPESPGFCQGSGHFSLSRLLHSPDVDYTMAPAAYAWREIGGTGACMTAPASVLLNGKVFWTQADLRSHWAPDIQAGHGRPANVAGSIQAMRREVAASLAMGTPIQWYEFTQGWLFGDERLTDEMANLQRVLQTFRTATDWPRAAYLAVVVDEEQVGTFDPFNPPYLLHLTFNQREKLTRSGVPWKCYLFRDVIEHPEVLEHRAFLFLNLFRLTPEQRQFLKEKVLNSGRTVAFVGPVGLLDGSGLSAANTSDLLGWEMETAPAPVAPQGKFLADLPAPWKACAGMEIGMSKEFTPAVRPKAPGKATVLALGAGEWPVVLFEARPDVKLFWSACPGLPPALIRALAESAGVPVVSADDQAVYAGYGYVGVHAASERPVRVRLPQPATVKELITGHDWPAGTQDLTLDMKSGETLILQCR
ncbi:MAG: hypothetical protein A3K19_25850 [Lentisphaerae bacterium RIFOXYB12_FULL_65_16]|nr:MAG: hypothetical protein A3K18_31850 [Lentisphaerae bacterium RIFOXYA12_64_32]OGV91395.1 MAG: hypothetical protein A3K19_25850 [Lentisphaerae bacterium RIFOXYB12_FULL_65_16]